MATLSPYLDIPQHILLNPPLPLMLPRRFSDHSDAHFDQHEFQSNYLDSGRLSSNAAPLSGLGIRNLDLSKDLESKSYFQNNQPTSHAQVSYARRYRRRTPRVESTYDTLNETMDSSVMKPLDNPSSIPSTWSFSSVIKAAELAADEAVHEMESALSLDLGIGDLGTASIFLDTEDQISWASEKLLAAPGTLVSHFISQLSANDSILERQYLDQAAQIHMGDSQSQTTYNFQEENLLTSAATYTIPELSLPLVVDIDMRNANINNPCIGVNPADILPALLSPPSLFNVPQYYSYLSDPLSTIEPTVGSDFFRQDNVINMEHPGFQAEVTYQISHDIVPAPACADSTASKQASDDEHSVFHSPASSDYSPSLESPVLKPTLSIKGNKRRRIVRTKCKEESDFIYSETHDDRHQSQGLDLPVNLGTPVLDAHRGVELEELKAKAERYRLRNQGRDYDKRWLISFAGKLSVRGELIEEFRCYITGCGQINKRRDHILIHVGAHLDQRPFKCRHWYVFLIIYQATGSYRLKVHRVFCARMSVNDTNLVTLAFDLIHVIFAHFRQQLSFVKIY
jgi:hypothetical protein